jgi:hypothetical protein
MTPEQEAELRQAARSNPDCADALAARDCDAIAVLLSPGRMRANGREIGYGVILETVGIEAGNRLIDFIQAQQELRHVVQLLANGWLRIGSPLAQGALQSFVPVAISQANADALCALGIEPDPYTAQQVAAALYKPDGSDKPWQ